MMDAQNADTGNYVFEDKPMKIESFSISLTSLSNGFVVAIEGYGNRYRLPTTKAFADSLESAASLITDTLNSSDFNAIDIHDEQAKYVLGAAGGLISGQIGAQDVSNRLINKHPY